MERTETPATSLAMRALDQVIETLSLCPACFANSLPL